MRARNYLATIFLVIAGSLLHFVFRWSDSSLWIAPVSPVNESVWEHLKMAYWPATIVLAIECYFKKSNRKSVVFARAVGVLVTCLLIVLGAQLNDWLLEKHFLVLDISLFIVSVYLGYVYTGSQLSRKLTSKPEDTGTRHLVSGWIIWSSLAFAFVTFTFLPPKTTLFRDPVTGTYGIPENSDLD